MTIRRKYSLPNCTLLVEGLNDGSGQSTDLRPLLSMLVNVECHFTNSNQPPLTGGRDFFESLVRAVSAYAQEFLSNVYHPEAHKNEPGVVQLHKIAQNRHRLIVQSEDRKQGSEVNSANAHYAGAINPFTNPIAIDLTTVQLFDLVEAVDQFFADSQTLPDLSLKLAPVPKRYTASSQPLVKQAVPAAVGVSSLAIAAIAFFLMPVPQPQEPKPSSSTQSLPARESNNVSSTAPAVPEITDVSQINALQQQLYNQLNQAWQTRSDVEQDLIYRVVVDADGAIVGYKSVSATANDGIEQTPLPDLLKNPAASSTASQQAITQFKVGFTKEGTVQVNPW